MNSSSFSGKNDSIFEVMPDEAAFSLQYKSELLRKNPSDVEKPLIPPSESVIVDIIMDPAVFTRMSTPVEAWEGVITPLFTGTEETKPFLHQVFNDFFKFLKERETIFLEIVDKENDFINFQRKEHNDAILNIYSEYNPPYPFIDYANLGNLNFSTEISKIIPDKHYFLPNPIYAQTTKKIIANLLSRNSYFAAQTSIKWGFFACDIGSILNALLFFIRSLLPSSKAQGSPSTLNIPNFSDLLPRLSLENASFLPISNENERFTTKLMGYKKPYIQTRSTIISNGKYLYILGSDSTITRVSLSNYDPDKFKNFSVVTEFIATNKYSSRRSLDRAPQSCPNFHSNNNTDLFISLSNGYMLISGATLIDHESIYSLDPFVKCSGTVGYRKSNMMFKSPKIIEPVASDGQYIYSLFNGKQINIFSLSFQEIIFIRSVELKKGHQELNKKYPTLIPKNWQDDAIIYTNGVIISFLVCKPIKESEFQYFVRHFSLLTGCHVEDATFHLDFQISSIAFDPWNCCQWIVTHNNKYESSIVKMPSEGSLPPWMTGVNYDDVVNLDLKKILASFSMIKNNIHAIETISDFLSYFTYHFAGSSFKSQRIGNNVVISQFFGLTSLESLVAAVESITTLISMLNSSNNYRLDKNQFRKSLSALIFFLQYSLSNNFSMDTFNDESLKPLSLRIINVLNHIISNDNLSFLHIPVSLTLITSFSVLFKFGYDTLPETISIMFNKMFRVSSDLVFFAIQFLSSKNLLQYSISHNSYGEVCIPIFNRLMKNKVEYPSTLFILISKFQYSLVTEIRRIVVEQQEKLTVQQENLKDLFFNYSQTFIETMTAFLDTPVDYLTRILPNSIFISLFRKWIMLVHPLHEYKEISHTLLFYLHNLLSKFIKVFDQCHKDDISLMSPDKEGFDFIYYFFFELFTAYIDLICSDFKSSTDFDEVTKYILLINAAVKAKINGKMMNDIASKLLDSSNSILYNEKKEIISKFKGIDEGSVDIYLDLILREEKPDIKLLFDFLYSKAKGNINKRLSDDERYIERIIFAAFMKQFDFVSDTIQLINDLKESKTPEISAIIHHTMEFLYRIRRELQQSRQMTIQANEKQNKEKDNNDVNPSNSILKTTSFADNILKSVSISDNILRSVSISDNIYRTNNNSDNIELLNIRQNYPKYIQTLKGKCIFLIYIEKLFQLDENDIDNSFTKARKMIQSFFLNNYDPIKSFDFIESTAAAKDSIATGLNLINEILKSDINITYSAYFISKFIASKRIIKHITTYQIISDKPGKSTKEFIFNELDVMLSILCNMIIDITKINLSNSLMIFYSKFILALEKCNYKLAFKSVKHIIKHLFLKRKEMTHAHYSTSLSLISSCLFILMNDKDNENDSNKNSEKLKLMESLKEIIYTKNELDPDLLSVTRLLLYSGMERPFNSYSLIEYLKNCDIKYYHSGFSLLSDLIHYELNSDKENIFNFILNEIGQICCGGKTVFMDNMKLINEIDLKRVIIRDNTKKLKIKTPNLILNVCNYLILFCRRCLEKDIEKQNQNRIETRNTLINLFSIIISQRYDMVRFVKQVAVFAILSNSINSFRKNSLFKFITNNSIYYISDININDQAFFCWHLPIHDKSKPRWIPRTNELLPISFLPFSPEMFDQKSLLFPFFKHALTANKSNKDTVLNFFVLSSLTSYLSSKEFVQYFIDYASKIPKLSGSVNLLDIKRITFSENQEMFLYLLNQHLTQKSSGFLHINKPEPYFHLISPADIISYSSIDTSSKSSKDKTMDNSDLEYESNSSSAILINRKEIKFNKNNYSGFHCFATSVLHAKQPSFLEVDINDNICVGINSFSLQPNLSSTYLVSGVSKSIIFNSYPIKRVSKLSLKDNITIEFNPLTKRATIFDYKSTRIHSIKLSSSMACFFIYTFSNKKTIKYKLSHIPAQKSSISSDAAKYLCPFSGHVMFKHKKKPIFNPKIESDEQEFLDNSLKMFPVETLTDLTNISSICFKQNMSDSMFEQIDGLNPTKFFTYEKSASESDSNENNNENSNDNENSNLSNSPSISIRKRYRRFKYDIKDDIDKNPFLIYPQAIITECSGSLNIKKFIDIENSPIRIIYNKTSSKFSKFENCSNISTISQAPVYFSTHSSNTFSLLSRFDNVNENLIKIDSMNGDVLPLTEKLWPVFQLMPLHPLNYHILTTELINFFATGYVTNYRHELINRIFYRALSLNVASMSSLLNLFSFDEDKLIEYTTYLMLCIEPVRIKMISESKSPIDFNYNILEQNQGASSKYHQKKLAVSSIFSYFNQKDVFPRIISKWFTLLQKQFQDFGCHFVSFHHPSAAIVPSSVLSDSASSSSSPYSVLKTAIKRLKFIRIPLASHLIVFKSEFSHNSPTVANIQIRSKSSNSTDFDAFALSNNIVLVEGDSVTICPESNCTLDDFSVVVLPVFSTSNESLFDTFFNFIISMKYFVIFLSQHLNELLESNNDNENENDNDNDNDNENDNETIVHTYRTKIYEMFIDSFLIESPFFYNYASEILAFLHIKIPLIGSDLSPEFTLKLMLLSAYTDIKKFPFIENFLRHQQTTWDERMVIPLKLFFPEFLSNSDKSNISTILKSKGDDETSNTKNLKDFGLPSPPIPDILDFDSDLSQATINVKRIMKIRNTIVGYPFHLIIQLWAYYSIMLPPFKYRIISDKVIEVMFSNRKEVVDENCQSYTYSPNEVELICGLQLQPKVRYAYNKEMTDNVSEFRKKCRIIVPKANRTVFIEIKENYDFHKFHFAFLAISNNINNNNNISIDNDDDYSFNENDSIPPDMFIKKYREKFITDVKKLVEIGISEDEKLLSCFPITKFLKDFIIIKIDPTLLLKEEVDFQSVENHRRPEPESGEFTHSYCDNFLPVLCVRSSLLVAFNWLLYNDKISFDDDPTFRPLCHSMSPLLSIKKLNKLIDEQSNDDQMCDITVDRKIGQDVRSGASDKISMTIIAQISRQYKNSTLFRCRGGKPWRVQLVDESGFDAGGPGREILSEISNDISSINCGLFVETPDSLSGISNDHFLIPVSDPRLLAKEAMMQYRFIGVFIGVCIRSSIVQRLQLAPLVWNFLATGEITIEDIFGIDNQYKHLIKSLEEVLNNYNNEKTDDKSHASISEEEFQELFDLHFVVTSSRGEEVPLSQRGKFKKVTLANCSDFISMANEFRLNEIRQNLEEMREGLWENLNIKPPAFISGKLLENATCGTKELSYEALKRIITFNNVPYNQQQFVLKVIKNFSSDERSQFLRFITGRVMLPSLEIFQDEGSNNSTFTGNNANKMIDDFIIKVDQMKGQLNKLPTASTCFNQLHIPEYSTYEKAKEMISIAIQYTGTFENR